MLILGIESSCDDTSVALVRDGREILAHTRDSQIELHREYGGVVPEIASRAHLEVISLLIEETLRAGRVKIKDVDCVAATAGPGLIGSLLVGFVAAKGIAAALEVPLIAVNHLAGHLYSPFLVQDQEGENSFQPSFPFLGVILSGGHTAIYRVDSWTQYCLLGQTKDDAVGEAFDKVAKYLGLGYPGGPIIDQLAEAGRVNAISFPRPLLNSGDLDMSFSGVKTSVVHYLTRLGLRPEDIEKDDVSNIVASFREAVVEVLASKIDQAMEQTGIRDLVVAGGVSANKRLREVLSKQKSRLRIPPLSLCMDNAPMIAGLGFKLFQKGCRFSLSYNAEPNLPMDWAQKNLS